MNKHCTQFAAVDAAAVINGVYLCLCICISVGMCGSVCMSLCVCVCICQHSMASCNINTADKVDITTPLYVVILRWIISLQHVNNCHDGSSHTHR